MCELLLKYDTEISTLLNKKDETARDIANKKDCQNVLNVLKTQYDREGMFFIFLVILIKLYYLMNCFVFTFLNIELSYQISVQTFMKYN